jgi:transcriptional regulator with XRE-family HTH domain
MQLAAYRKRRGLTQERVASELGVKSKSLISMIERGERKPTFRLALKIEQWSHGEVTAAGMLTKEDAALLPGVAAA